MKYEKSCGAVIWRSNGGKREYLLVLNKKGNAMGHWGFPKGHVEAGESEIETAKREILEETGLEVDSFDDGFRFVTRYSPAKDVEKDVIYFLTEVSDGCIHIQQSEIAQFRWLDFDAARKVLTYDDALIKEAENFLSE